MTTPQLIDTLGADIVALQEVSSDQAAQFDAHLAAAYPHHILNTETEGRGLGLLSRYPIVEQEWFQPLPQSDPHLRAVIDVNGTPITVYVAHPHSPRGLFSPLQYDTSQRDAELADVRERVAAEAGPVIVMCDCNMSDQSDAYRAFDRLMDDAFRQAGRGMGFTFRFRRFLPSMVRIDYVWHSDHFVATDARAWEDAGASDHHAVVARLWLKGDRAASPAGETSE